MSVSYEDRLVEIFGFDLANAFSLAESDDTVRSIVGSSSGVDKTYLQTNAGRDRTVAELRSLIKAQLNGEARSPQAEEAVGIDLDDSETKGTPVVTEYSPEPSAVDVPVAPEFDADAYRQNRGLPEAWTSEDVHAYVLADGETHGVTRNLNHVIDPTRARRPLDRGELIDALSGDFAEYNESHHAALVDELRKVETVPAAWTVRAVVEYVKMNILPAKAEHASIVDVVWVEDISRNSRQPEAWTADELRAWLLRLIPAVGVSTEQKLAIEAKARFKLESENTAPAVREAYRKKTEAPTHTPLTKAEPLVQPSTINIVAAVVADAPVSVAVELPGLSNMNQTYIVESLTEYETVGKVGRPVSGDTGANLQKLLDNVIRYIVNLNDNQGFISAMNYLMAFVKKHQGKGGLFSYDYLYRWTGHLRSEGRIQESHKDFLQVIILLNDDSKQVRAQVDVPGYITHMPRDRQQRLLQYLEAKK